MIEKRVTPYELLTRFGLDGVWQGAHVIDAVRYVEADGAVSDPTLQPPRAVTAAEFAELLGSQAAALIEAADAATARAATAEAALVVEVEARAAAEAQLNEALAQLAAVRAAIGGAS